MSKSGSKLFSEHLERNGLRMTEQRSRILKAFLEKEGHFTTEEFYAYVKKNVGSVGQATVYRNLKLLVESGIARELDFGGGALYYEHQHGHDHHDHIICTRCGERTEVYSEKLEKLQEEIAEEHGHKLTGHKLYLYAVCPACR